MVTEFISQAWNAYRKNFWQILGAMALYIAIIFVLALVLLVPLFMAFLPSASIESQITVKSISGSQVGGGLYPAVNSYMIAAAAAVIVILMLVAIALRAGFVRVCADALKGKANLWTMFSVARKKFRTVVAANLLVLLLLAPLYILALLAAVLLAGTSYMMLIYFFVLLVPVSLVALLFSLVDQSVVVGGFGAVESVKKSTSIIKANYLQFLGLVVIITIASLLLSSLPIFFYFIFWIYNMNDAYRTAEKTKGKSSGIAVVLSFFIPGLGQIYNGQILKGLLFIIVSLFLIFILILLTIINIITNVIGSIISIFFVAPIANLSYTAFYIEKAGARRKITGKRKVRKRKR